MPTLALSAFSTQISHDAGLTLFRPGSVQAADLCIRGSDSVSARLCVQHVESRAILNQDYKLVIIQISHDSRLIPFLPTGVRTVNRCIQGNDSASTPLCGQQVESLTFVGFLDQDYRHKLVSTQCCLAEFEPRTAAFEILTAAASLCGQHIEFPAVVGFLDQDYCYKLVATQIYHDDRLTPFCSAGVRTVNYCIRGSDSTDAPLWDQHIESLAIGF